MKEILFIVSMLSFLGAVIVLINSIINYGIKGVFSKGQKSTKWMLLFFLTYVVSYVFFLIVSN